MPGDGKRGSGTSRALCCLELGRTICVSAWKSESEACVVQLPREGSAGTRRGA